MSKNWYVIHTYSGFEQKVRSSLIEQFERSERKEDLGGIIVPVRTLLKFVRVKRRFRRENFSLGIF